jgi:ATP synthase protein I
MPQSERSREEALERLGDRLKSVEAARNSRLPGSADASRISAGYRFVASLIGGVLMGVGFGWLFDRFLGTGPWGLVGGTLIGVAASTFTVVRQAARMSDEAAREHPAASVPFDDEDE